MDLASSRFSRFLSQVSDDTTSIEARQEGESTQDLFREIMAPTTLNVKFPLGTPFTFSSLTFVVGEDGELRMMPPGPAPRASG
jgi:hypothetical protein